MVIVQVENVSDAGCLLTPVIGEGRMEKALAETFSLSNFSEFGPYGYVMVTMRNDNSILEPEVQ